MKNNQRIKQCKNARKITPLNFTTDNILQYHIDKNKFVDKVMF